MLAQLEEHKNLQSYQHALKKAHKVEIYKNIDAAAIDEINAKIFRENFMKVREDLRSECLVKAEMDQALLNLKVESKQALSRL